MIRKGGEVVTRYPYGNVGMDHLLSRSNLVVSESKPLNETLLETSVDSKIKYERQFKDESETMLTLVNSFLIPNPIPIIY